MKNLQQIFVSSFKMRSEYLRLWTTLLLVLLFVSVISGPIYAVVTSDVQDNQNVDAVILGQVVLSKDDQGKVVVANRDDEIQMPQYVPGQIIVKYKETVTYSVREIIRQKMRFKDHVANDGSSLDRMHHKYGVKRAQPIFRTEAEEDSIIGQKDLNALQRLHENKIRKLEKRFGMRKARAPKNYKLPDLSHVYKLDLGADADVLTAVREFQDDPNIEYAHPNFIAHTMLAPNDSYYSTSGAWGQAFDDLWGLKNIQAEQAWDITQGDGVVVAVVDTGVDYTHPDIAANMLQGVNCVNEQGQCIGSDPMDDHGHGTHVAGTIAAVGNNSVGIIGVAPNAKIIPVKALDATGSGDFATLANALMYAADSGASVINNSWGCDLCGYWADNYPESFPEVAAGVPVVEEAVQYAYGLGSVVIFAAGNMGVDVNWGSPARVPEAITVSAFDHNDQKAQFSNIGLVDVAAPGGGGGEPAGNCNTYASILSLKSSQNTLGENPDCPLGIGEDYLRLAGTSMAAPHVSGLAALVLAEYPGLTVEQTRQAIRKGADDVGLPGVDTEAGYGRINALNTLYESGLGPLAVRLTDIQEVVADHMPLQVYGLVGGENLNRWRFEVASMETPEEWIAVTDWQTSQFEQVGLLAEITSSLIPQGTNIIRLVAESSSGEIYEDRDIVTFKQVNLFKPRRILSLEREIARTGDQVEIIGTAAVYGFVNYIINIYREDGSLYDAAVVILANDGLQEVVADVLGVWDTTGVPDGTYNVELVVTQETGAEVRPSMNGTILLDSSIHQGWPLSLTSKYGGGQIRNGDVNGDGVDELILLDNGVVSVLDHSGNVLPGWPQVVEEGRSYARTLAVGDVTGDSIPEIVVPSSNGDVFVWSGNGNLLPGWPQTVTGGVFRVALEDISGNGNKDIIISTKDSSIHVLDNNAQPLPGWPVSNLSSYQAVNTELAVGDIDKDGGKEIVLLLKEDNLRLYVFERDGSLKQGWPLDVSSNAGSASSNIALGDLDGDQDFEIFVSGGQAIYAYHHDGSYVSGWPVSTDRLVRRIALGDVTGNAQVNVVAVSAKALGPDETIYVYGGDGSMMPGWPVRVDTSISKSDGNGAPIIQDITGDSILDVLVPLGIENRNPNPIYAYKGNGELIAGFPKYSKAIARNSGISVLASDFDGDGQLELAWMDEYNAYIWDMQVTADNICNWCSTYGNAANTSALQQEASGSQLSPIIDSFAPTTGVPVGGGASILGSNFCLENCGLHISSYPDISVTINGVAVTEAWILPTVILFNVPAGATTGPIVVTTPGGTATSTEDFIVLPPPPVIDSFAPTTGVPVGGGASILGSNFCLENCGLHISSYPDISVTINGVAVTEAWILPTVILFNVPAGATTGPIVVTTPGGTATSTEDFVVE